MMTDRKIEVFRVTDESQRQQALEVMRTTYRDEKDWVRDDNKLIAREDVASDAVSWFVARDQQAPVGVLRVLYTPPLDLYRAYGFNVVAKGIDLDAFIRNHRIAEIGRFAIVPNQRKNVRLAVALMNAAVKDTVEREFTHYITDVFEGEQHSPFEFHSRVMGFEVVATHETGELNCACRRITMLLDIKRSYQRMHAQNSWIFRGLTSGWGEHLHHRLRDGDTGTVAAQNSRTQPTSSRVSVQPI